MATTKKHTDYSGKGGNQEYHLLTERGITNLHQYSYSGTDHSLYYKYLASPFAQLLNQTFTPLWVAPNVITLTGFLINVIGHALVWWYCPTMTESYPAWIGTACGVGTMLYQTLDNMDGKQARKTGTSSPLGQLFDHGCDSVSTVIFMLNIGSLLHVTSGDFAWLFACTITGFYVTIWEEFHTHRFNLPIVNGPNEGLLLIAALCLLAGIVGGDWFDNTIRAALLAAFSLSAALTICSHVSRTVLTTSAHPRWFDVRAPITRALWRLIPMALMDAYILYMGGSDAVARMPYIFYWAVGLNFASFDALFMVKLLCDEPPRMLPKRLWPMLAIAGYSYLHRHGIVPYPEDSLLVLYFLFSLFHFSTFVHTVVTEMCRALNINAFTIPVKVGRRR
jgi:ethanolaminephosphotransferase